MPSSSLIRGRWLLGLTVHFLDFLVLSLVLSLSLSSQQILYAKYQLAVGPLPLRLNLVWYKYRGLAPLGRVHPDTKCFEHLRRVVSFVFKIRYYRIHIKSKWTLLMHHTTIALVLTTWRQNTVYSEPTNTAAYQTVAIRSFTEGSRMSRLHGDGTRSKEVE